MTELLTHSTESDERLPGLDDLVRRFQEGDESAFADIYSLTQTDVKAAAILYGPAGHEDDVVQETYIKAFRHMEKFHGNSSFSTWLFRITMNVGYTLQRRQYRFRNHVPIASGSEDDGIELVDEGSDGDPDAQFYASELEDRLHKVLLPSLSDKLRRVVELKLMGYSHREIEGILGIGESSVKQRLVRARAILRAALD